MLISGSRICFRSCSRTSTRTVAPRRAGSPVADPSLASARRVSPGRAPTSDLAQVGDRAVAEPQLRLEPELDLLDLVEHAAVRAEEHQVGRDEVAQLRGPLELGHDLAVPLEVLAEIGLDVGVADRPDRALQREPLVIRQRELRADLDVDLELHRALFGQLDGRDVELRLGDRVELVVLVELLQRRHQQRRLDLVGDLLLESLDHQLSGCAPGPEARYGHVLAEVVERLVELPLDLAARDRDLDVLLARADVADVDLHLQLARPRVRLCRDRLIPHRDGGAGLAFLLLGAHRWLPLGVIPGWDGFGSATTQPTRSSESRQPEMASIQSGRRDLNPRQPRWQRGALPLSYSRIIRQGLMLRPAARRLLRPPAASKGRFQV